ncbi:hypothetical protein [Bacillus dakarensis]|uniref:hypothetical protein n=1 Tax=Robertmurraya dakarensis TaxID=1926278 RepID=UPI000980B8F2|nr:hypothetical protein [Bacillus dakarensis]
MYHIAYLFLACVLAGFALANLPSSSLLTAGAASFLGVIGVIAIIVFSFLILYLGVKALFKGL